nr:hypothetical protein [Acinetobacter genomosp. 33YU]
MVGAIFGLCFWFGYPVVSKYYHAAKKDSVPTKTQSDLPQPNPDPSSMTLAEKAQRDAYLAGLTPEQYADLMHPEKRNAELQAKNDVRMDTIAIKYNPNRPYDVDTSQIQYEVTAKPVFSGCMKKHGKYVAYTQQGTVLHDVSQSDCRKLMEDGDRPFNYFQKQQEQLVRQDSSQSVQQTNADFAAKRREVELIAKYEAAKLQGLI